RTLKLPPVKHGVSRRIVADQHLGERRVVFVQLWGKRIAGFKIKFVLATFFDRHGSGVTAADRVFKNRGPKLFVDQNAGTSLWHTLFSCQPETVLDNGLACCDRRNLFGSHWLMKTEHFLAVRLAMVERQNVEWAIVSDFHGTRPRW